MSSPEPTRAAESPAGSSMDAPEKNETLPVTEPIYESLVYPDFFTAAHLPPGTYMSAGFPATSPDEDDKMRRRLKSLGFMQSMSGLLSVLLGLLIVLMSRWYVSSVIMLGTPWWMGLFSTVAGMLALAVRNSSQTSVTVGCLLMNIINALASLPAIILYGMSINFYPCFGFFCFISYRARMISSLLVFLLLNCIFTLVLSIVVVTYNCRNLRCCTDNSPMTMVVVQAAPPPPQPNSFSNYPADEQPPAYSEPQTAIYNVPV